MTDFDPDKKASPVLNNALAAIGSSEWADAAERSEWGFMAKMLREADEELRSRGFHMSGLGVARDIAAARNVEGWRTFKATNPE